MGGNDGESTQSMKICSLAHFM